MIFQAIVITHGSHVMFLLVSPYIEIFPVIIISQKAIKIQISIKKT